MNSKQMEELNSYEFKYYEIKCDLSKNYIEYKCNNQGDAFMEYTYIDPSLPKSFFGLLRSSVDFLKEKNITNIVQSVLEDDWNKFLVKNDKWKIRTKINVDNSEMKYVIIECKINDALNCISSGLGIF